MKKRKLVLTILLFLFSLTAISYFMFVIIENNKKYNYSNLLLFDVKYNMEILRYYQNRSIKDIELQEKVEEMLFRKLMILSDIRPNIDNLKGTPLIALVSVINYKRKYQFFYNGPFFSKNVINYLEEIEKELIERIKYYKGIRSIEFAEFYRGFEAK